MEINKIYNEDCLKGMARIPDKSIDMICTDLPYGVANKSNPASRWDSIIPFEPLWEQYRRIIKDNGAIVLFAQGMFAARLMVSNADMWRYNLIWKKGKCVTGFLDAKRRPLRNYECVCIFYKKQPTYNPQMIIEDKPHLIGKAGKKAKGIYGNFNRMEPRNDNKRYPTSILDFTKDVIDSRFHHPTQKPVALVEWLIRTYTDRGELVLDNCMGSGTTAIAAINTDRNFIGFELDKEYYGKCLRRIESQYKTNYIEL